MNTENVLDFAYNLDRQELNTLQIAALLGDTFSLDHLVDVSKIKLSQLIPLIDKLVKENIISQALPSDKVTYSFTKSKLSKIILESLGQEEKKLYLIKIISYFEKELPNNDNKLLMLANLYLKLEGDKDYLQHKKKAADLLAKIHKKEEAVCLYKEIIDSLFSKDRDSIEDVLLIDTILCYAPIALSVHPPESIFRVIQKAKRLVKGPRNDREKVLLELCLGYIAETQGNSTKASRHNNKASRLGLLVLLSYKEINFMGKKAC